MAESKKRKKNGREATDDTEIQNWTDGIPLSPAWWAPAFVTLLILGLLWVVVYYISSGTYPVPKLGAGNIAGGLGTMMVGFRMPLRWRGGRRRSRAAELDPHAGIVHAEKGASGQAVLEASRVRAGERQDGRRACAQQRGGCRR